MFHRTVTIQGRQDLERKFLFHVCINEIIYQETNSCQRRFLFFLGDLSSSVLPWNCQHVSLRTWMWRHMGTCIQKHWHILALNICDGLVAAEHLWGGWLLRTGMHLCVSGNCCPKIGGIFKAGFWVEAPLCYSGLGWGCVGKLKLTLSAVVTGFKVWKNKIFWYIFPVSGQKIIGLLKNYF